MFLIWGGGRPGLARAPNNPPPPRASLRNGLLSPLQARIRDTYSLIYASCQKAGVTHPSFVAMGLGIFLPQCCQDDVKSVYFEVQFELLSSRNYGFDTVFINPGPPSTREIANCLLEQNNYAFPCHVVIHDRDAKMLAIWLAQNGRVPPRAPCALLGRRDDVGWIDARALTFGAPFGAVAHTGAAGGGACETFKHAKLLLSPLLGIAMLRFWA